MSKIKELREQCGLTQEEFGDKIGMSQQTVSRIEKNIDSLVNTFTCQSII